MLQLLVGKKNQHSSYLHGEGSIMSNSSRAIKLDFPKFAAIDPKGWIFQAEEYFTNHGIDDSSKP